MDKVYTPTEWKRGDLITSHLLNLHEQATAELSNRLTQAESIIVGNTGEIQANAQRIEEATAAAIASINANTTKIDELTQQTSDHLEASTDVVAKVSANISAIAGLSADLQAVERKATQNESDVSTLRTSLSNITAEGGAVDSLIDAKTAAFITDTQYNADQQTRKARYDTEYATKEELGTTNTNVTTLQGTVTTLQGTVSSHTSSIATLTDDVSTLQSSIATATTELATAKSLIQDNADRIQANAQAAEEATASIQANASRIETLANNAAAHIAASEEVVANVNQNVSDIATLKTSMTTVKEDTLTAVNDAAAAKVDAAAAVTKANAAQTASEAAQTASTAAQAAATSAEASSQASATSASEAATSAETAITTANNANTTATSALGTASEAKSTATLAKEAVDTNTAAIQAQNTRLDGIDGEITALQTAGYIKSSQLSGLVAVDGVNVTSAKHIIPTTKNGTKTAEAIIWNERSGGGVQVVDYEHNKKSFIGVNLGAEFADIWAQFYAVDTSTNIGTRMNMTDHGVYIVEDKNTYTYTSDDKVVTRKELKALENDPTIPGQIQALLSRLQLLEAKVDESSRTDVQVVDVASITNATVGESGADSTVVVDEPSEGKKTITATDKDLVISSGNPITDVTTITAKSITIQEAVVDSARLDLKSTGSVGISNLSTTGTLSKDTSNALTSINTPDYVRITDSTIGSNSYNAIEIGLNSSILPPKNVLIDNITFSGTLSNNAISLFGTQDNATVTISNVHVTGQLSNFLRLSNRTNTHLTVNLINCDIDTETADNPYKGIILLQDYSETSDDAAKAANRFGPDKLKINIINCSLSGKKITPVDDLSTICGSKDANQLVYAYCKSVWSYDANYYPSITIA